MPLFKWWKKEKRHSKSVEKQVSAKTEKNEETIGDSKTLVATPKAQEEDINANNKPTLNIQDDFLLEKGHGSSQRIADSEINKDKDASKTANKESESIKEEVINVNNGHISMTKTAVPLTLTAGETHRLNLQDLEKPENKGRKEAFLKAWYNIKNLSPDNPKSFWAIASLHGLSFKSRMVEPFNYTGGWDSYGQHKNVLFPFWNRMFLFHLEKALQDANPDGVDVALHFWDATSGKPLPALLTNETVTIKINDIETKIPNPLLGFKFQIELKDIVIAPNEPFYRKPPGYETVRFPKSGIKNPSSAKIGAEHYNQVLPQPINAFLENINQFVSTSYNRIITSCLSTENFNQFSNMESAGYKEDTYSLEHATEAMLVILGGFDVKNPDWYEGTQGDLAAVETMAFDPLFYLYLSDIDRFFQKWATIYEGNVTIDTSDPNDPGITPKVGQGPTIFQTPENILDMNTSLYPFYNTIENKYYTPEDYKDISQLKYDYIGGSSPITPTVKTNWPKSGVTKVFKKISEIIKFLEEEKDKLEYAGHLHLVFKIPDEIEHDMSLKADAWEITEVFEPATTIPLSSISGFISISLYKQQK